MLCVGIIIRRLGREMERLPAAGRGSLVVGVLALLGFKSGHVGEHGLTAEGTRDTMLQRLDSLRSVGWSGWSGARRFAGFVDGWDGVAGLHRGSSGQLGPGCAMPER